MSPALQTVAICVGAYLVGSLPFGLWIGLLKGVDIRKLGSGNIGATNVRRVLGSGPAALVFLLDVCKGAGPALIARAYLPVFDYPSEKALLVGACAVLGHTASPFLKFRGGKGVATALGTVIAGTWMVATGSLIMFAICMFLTRYVSLSSLIACGIVPIGAYFWGEPITVVAAYAGLVMYIFWKHRGNISRLRDRTEPKFGEGIKSPKEAGNFEPQTEQKE